MKGLQVALVLLAFIVVGGCCYGIYYFTFYQVKLSPKDPVCIAKCSTCDNLIVSRSEKDSTCKWSDPCERFRGYKYLAKVVTPKDNTYCLYKLKYEFYSRSGKNFDKFYEWYKIHKDEKFYKYVKHYTAIEDHPVYETRYRTVTRHIGLTTSTQRLPYSVIVGWKQVPVRREAVVYEDPKDAEYTREDCDVFEYYVGVER